MPRNGAPGISAVVRAPPYDALRAARAGRPAGRPPGRVPGAVWRWRRPDPGDDLRRPRRLLGPVHDSGALRPAPPVGPLGLAPGRTPPGQRRRRIGRPAAPARPCPLLPAGAAAPVA